MKKVSIVISLALILPFVTSCHKAKYCQCTATCTNQEDVVEQVELGDDYYIIETGTCNDKAKEIIGWGQVICREVDVDNENDNWFWNLINHNNNNNNNHNNNNNNHGGKP